MNWIPYHFIKTCRSIICICCTVGVLYVYVSVANSASSSGRDAWLFCHEKAGSGFRIEKSRTSGSASVGSRKIMDPIRIRSSGFFGCLHWSLCLLPTLLNFVFSIFFTDVLRDWVWMASDPGGGSYHHQPPLSTPLHCSTYLGLLGKEEGHDRNSSYLWTYELYGPVRYAFDAGKSITRASGWGLGPGNRDFLGPVKWHQAVGRVPFGAQKSHV